MPTTAEGDSPVTEASEVRPRGSAPELGAAFKQLFDSVGDLAKCVADIKSADIKMIRAKARVALTAIQGTIHDGASQMRRQASYVDTYVRNNPWQSIGAATLAGLAIGLLITGD
ncbi:MAG TPA: hypothetical protein VNR70_12100 [Steroidobacteraceae bacterium]|nr:hypothetical protein [Steroidobacteraceae bacterium]